MTGDQLDSDLRGRVLGVPAELLPGARARRLGGPHGRRLLLERLLPHLHTRALHTLHLQTHKQITFTVNFDHRIRVYQYE